MKSQQIVILPVCERMCALRCELLLYSLPHSTIEQPYTRSCFLSVPTGSDVDVESSTATRRELSCIDVVDGGNGSGGSCGQLRSAGVASRCMLRSSIVSVKPRFAASGSRLRLPTQPLRERRYAISAGEGSEGSFGFGCGGEWLGGQRLRPTPTETDVGRGDETAWRITDGEVDPATVGGAMSSAAKPVVRQRRFAIRRKHAAFLFDTLPDRESTAVARHGDGQAATRRDAVPGVRRSSVGRRT